MSELLTTLELAEKLKVTRQCIYNWRKQGLPALKIGRAVRFDLQAVNEWINKHNEAGENE
jgi:excisionase family DNA binding protein